MKRYLKYQYILMISSSQLKAARDLLGWTAKDLSENSGVGLATIRRYELQQGVINANKSVCTTLISTLVDQGIEFLGDPELNPGVMLHIKQQV